MIDFRSIDFNRNGIFGLVIGTAIMGIISLINNIRRLQFHKKQIDIVSLLNQEKINENITHSSIFSWWWY